MQVYMLIMVGQEARGMIWILAYVGYASVHAQLYLPPKYGLYLSFVPPLIYAFIGSSRDIAMGPVAVVSLLLGTLLRDEVEPNTPEYLCLAFTATFFAGVTQAALGFFRLKKMAMHASRLTQDENLNVHFDGVVKINGSIAQKNKRGPVKHLVTLLIRLLYRLLRKMV
ncbi:sulfate transporter 1.2-like isoform X1 [Helianthus annuus]|uniref:sulfate transporter 1.2-like isoform X1 n=1 Tax=Helianthus annuus TaxID=4232 RepID=UPI000B8F713C|nr:sulfate transporter 1.2-like isoform X1 [Helianthus annuus]